MRKGEAKMGLRKRLWTVAVTAALLGGVAVASQQTAVASTAQTATISAATHSSSTHLVIPNIQFRQCSGQSTTWADIDIITPSGLQDWCFGYTGIWTFGSSFYDITAFCSGNNEGHLSYYLPDGVLTGFSFGPGRLVYFAQGSKIYQLHITGWTGSDRCYS
jgi:hypothetical protein